MEASRKDSDTEVNVFRVVANPAKINSEARPPTSAAQPVPVVPPPAAAAQPSLPTRATPPVMKPAESLFRDAVKVQAQGADRSAKPPQVSSAPAPAPVKPASQSPPRPRDQPDVVLEKQATLMEIEQLRSQGSVITRRFQHG